MQSWVTLARRVPTAAVSVCAALVLCSGVVTALVLPASSDSTAVLRNPVRVSVTPVGGSAARAHDGQVLSPGDIVTVGAGGAGEIVTGARKLLLGGAGTGTQVRVDGPASTEIRRGSVVAINPGKVWSLQADQVAVGGITGAVRIDYGYTVRVADYTGRADLSVPTGATARLVGLDQVEAAGSVFPPAPVPLRLSDDALDTAADNSLVVFDRALTALAGQIDADPNVLAYLPSTTENPSETLLPAAIGAAGTGGTPDSRAKAALASRQAQASWGVVAVTVDAALPGVRSALSRLLDNAAAQPVAAQAADTKVLPTTAASSRPVPGTVPTATSGPQVSASPSPSVGIAATAPTARGSAPAAPSPSVSSTAPARPGSSPQPPTTTTAAPSPSPSPTPVLTLLLTTVGGLLPSPNPVPITLGRPSASPSPSAASPAPLVDTVVTTVTGVLGGSGR